MAGVLLWLPLLQSLVAANAQQLTASHHLDEQHQGGLLPRQFVPLTWLSSDSTPVYCQQNVPACTRQTDLRDACQSQYPDAMSGYCLCTTGYYEMVQSCDACSVSQGVMSMADYSEDVLEVTRQCNSLSIMFAYKMTGNYAVTTTDTVQSKTTDPPFSGLIGDPGTSAVPTASRPTSENGGRITCAAGDSAYAVCVSVVMGFMLEIGWHLL